MAAPSAATIPPATSWLSPVVGRSPLAASCLLEDVVDVVVVVLEVLPLELWLGLASASRAVLSVVVASSTSAAEASSFERTAWAAASADWYAFQESAV